MPPARRALVALVALALAGAIAVAARRRPASPITPEPPAAARRADLSPCRTPDQRPWSAALGLLEPASLTADRAGNTFVAGHVWGPTYVAYVAGFGPDGAPIFRAEIGKGVAHGITVDRSGDLLVFATLGGPRSGAVRAVDRPFLIWMAPHGVERRRLAIGRERDAAQAIAVDAEGNIAALIERDLKDDGRGVLQALALDPAGVLRWGRPLVRAAGAGTTLKAQSIAAGADGTLVVAGSYQGSPDLGGGALPREEISRAFLVALDRTGAHRFSRPIGAGGGDGEPHVITDAAGRIFAVAAERGESVMGHDASLTVVMGLDPAGTVRFEHRLRHDVRPTGLAIGGGGEIVVTGRAGDPIVLDGRVLLSPRKDAFALSFDPNGEIRFAATLPASFPAPALLPDGALVVTDWTSKARALHALCPTRPPVMPADPPQPRVDEVRASYPLPGGQGRLELLMDARIPAGFDRCWKEAPGFDSPALGAAVRLVGASGEILDQRRYFVAQAKAEGHRLYGDERVTLAFTDSPVCWPQRSPETIFIEAAGGKLRELHDHRGFPIRLGLPRTVPARRGSGRDILDEDLHSASGTGERQVLTLTRLTFADGRWVRLEKDLQEEEWPESAGRGEPTAPSLFP